LPELEGRKLWFAGIGGAGMSGLAVVAGAWGAELAGWDRNETPYLAALVDVPIEISPEPPEPPAGWEVIFSTAFADRVEGRSRGELLAEFVGLRRSIVVAGAHGKTTTTAMIAFCLDHLGLDPTFLIGGQVSQLGSNARAGSGWLVAEGDESDRSLALLHPDIAVLTNVDLDHHTTFGSRAEVERFFKDWLDGCPLTVRSDELAPVSFDLAVPGEHNRRNAAGAIAALELAGVDRSDAESALAGFRGVGRRLEYRGEVGGVLVVDDYGHHPAEISTTIAAVRDLHAGSRILVLFQPHLFSRTRHLSGELAEALTAADGAWLTEIYAAREDPVAGVTGKVVADELARRRPGMPIGWAPALEDAVQGLACWAREGDVLLTVGAGDVDRAPSMLLARLRSR
jgi:UDP-N-acetylmuramate--alanine ligase